MANSVRFGTGAADDNTFRTKTRDYQAPAYAATISIVPTKEETLVKVGQLTGALALNIGVGDANNPPYIGDEIEFIFSCDGTNRVVTPGTGTKNAGTLTVVASKYGALRFRFDGANWIEVSRTLTA